MDIVHSPLELPFVASCDCDLRSPNEYVVHDALAILSIAGAFGTRRRSEQASSGATPAGAAAGTAALGADAAMTKGKAEVDAETAAGGCARPKLEVASSYARQVSEVIADAPLWHDFTHFDVQSVSMHRK